MKSKIQNTIRIKKKVRASIGFGTASRPRLSVFRSNKHICAQAIDDEKGITIVSASDIKIKGGKKMERAIQIGKEMASKLLAKKITTVIFDRNGYRYTGCVQAIADAARKGGLKF